MGHDKGMADVNGTRLYYEVRGSGPALVFLHGFTLDHRMWRRQVDSLSASHRIVTYDARGFGRSPKPDNQPYRHCDDAAALCRHLGVTRVVAIGHSIGAHQTLELALSRPDLVAGWVAICMAGLAGIPFPEDITKMFATLRQTATEQGVDAAKQIWGSCPWFKSARQVPALAAELDAMLADYSGWHWTHQNPAKSIEPPAAERLAELRMPVLVATGLLDLPYHERIADAVLAYVPDAQRLRLDGAGHMANMEQPEAISDAIAALAARALPQP